MARCLLALAALAVASNVQAAPGRLGFSVSVETDGMFSVTLKKVTISAVVADAPAAQAGLRQGDDVEAVDDVVVEGAGGSRIMDIVHAVQPGDHLRLKVIRGGLEHLVDIVGGAVK